MSEGTVRCNVCGSPYTLPEDEIVGNLPHVLLCSHIFCTACLRALESPQTIITCPECQMDTNVGEEGVDGLQVDSRIIGLIYTARMNAKKGRSGDRRKCQRVKSPPPASGVVQTQGIAEGKSDLRNSLDEALSKATDNLNQLDTLHQTLVRGIHSQLRNERTRIKREIDEAVDKAISILHKRRSVLVSNLSVVELLFSDGQKECERIEKRVKELSTAIQKARHVRQVPSLETYCDVDEVLEILQIPVDVESYDMSALSLRSGLSCRFQVESLTESVKNCLKITDDNDTVLEEVALKSTRCLGKKEPPEKCKDVLDIPCDLARANQRNQSSPDPIPTRKSTRSPNFMQEIMEDIEPCSEIPRRTCSPPVAEPRHKERHKVQRRHRRPQFDKPFSQPKILHEWVMVTHIVNPEHFYVRYMMEHKSGLKLTKKIKAFCSGEQSHFTFSDEIKTGSLLFVRWKEDMWCRVTVSEVFRRDSFPGVTKCPASEVSHLRVFFQDYGFSKGLSLAKDEGLRGLNESLRRPDAAALSEIGSWVPQAIRCSLKDIIPADLGKGWSSEASDEMRRLLGSNTVEMQVFGDDGDTLLVDLKKTHMVSLRDHLVFMELARFYSPMAAPGVGTPLLFYPPVPPKLHVELCAVVSYVNTPSDFYIQLVDNMEFLLLHAKLQDCYGPTTKDSEFQVYCASLYQACVALCDEEWSRAQVTGFQGGRMVEVRYVDFGNRKTVSVKDLRQIKDEFFALPEMAVWCSLSDLVSVEDTWSDEACKVFKELTENKLVTVVAKKLVPSTRPVPICMLEISEDCTAANIGEILVGKGLASFSKQPLVKDPQPVETAVWDPPFEEELLSAVDQTPSPPVTEELKPNLILPACVKDLRVRVTHVTSPANICVQLLQSDGQLKRIHDLLKSLYSKSEPQEVDWEPEMFCAANNTGVWERGQVCSLSSNSTAEIFRCDFGNKMKFHVNNLRPLRSDLIGSYSLECCLSGIRPAGGRSTWTATACDFISHYLTGATAIMTLKEPSSARPVPVSMYCSNGAGQSVSITDFLISEGLALKERNPSYEKAFPESEDCVIEEIIEIQGTESPPQTPQTPPTPAPRINPPPERVRTHAYPPPELPPCGHLLMNISAISEQGVIYAMTPQAVCEFDRLRERLQQHIKSLPRQKNYNWRGVLGCAVMGTDMLWYRGQVQEVIGGHVKVRYVDQGLVESIPVCHVYPKVLCEDVPQLCVPCQIHGVIPIGKGWQWDAVVLMRELLLGRSVNVHVMEHPEDPSGCVTVKIMVDGMPLSKIMVHHQYATFDPTISSEEDYVVKPPFPDLDDWDLNTEGLEEPQPVLGVYTERKLPPKGKHFRVKVKHIRTPNEVFLCPLNNTACKQDEEISLEEALARVNENVENLAKLTDFPIEGSCLAEYSDGKYYRAKLMGFSELSPTVKILVRHVDFGSDDILPIHKLRQLPTSLLDFPCAAAYVQLVGFKPPRVCMEAERVSYRPEWSMRAMLEMIDLLNRDLSAVVTATEPQVKVLLYNMDGSLLHTPLVEKGLADYD